MSEVKQFRLPDVGEGLTEADIVAWHVKPGDSVALNQVIVEIETAKAVVELPSPYEGMVTELLAEEGATVDVGTPIITVDVSAGADAGTGRPATTKEAGHRRPPPSRRPAATRRPARPLPSRPAWPTRSRPPLPRLPGPSRRCRQAFEPGIDGSPAPKVERQAVLVGYGVKLGTTKRRQRKEGSARTCGRRVAAAPSTPPWHRRRPRRPRRRRCPAVLRPRRRRGTGGPGARPAAKPPVRKLAKDLGVDLAGLAGTGPDGTITREDVQAAVAAPATPAAP